MELDEGQKIEVAPVGTASNLTQVPFHLIKISPKSDLLALVSGSCFSVFNLKLGQFVQFQGEESYHHSDLIRSAAWNSSGTYLATAADDKIVKVWRIHDGVYEYHGETKPNTKKLTSVVFGSDADGEVVVFADKFGEVFSAPVSQLSEPPKVLLGHVSILTEVLLSPNGEYVLSADRDEKIRVSQFPKAYNIEAYCLAHTEIVSRIHIAASQPSILFSGSADGTVRVWRYLTGELLHTEDLRRGNEALRIVTLPVAFSDAHQLLAVLVEGVPSVYLFKLVDGKELNEVHALPLKAAPWDAAFDREDNLWVATSAGVEVFSSRSPDASYEPVDQEHALGTAAKTLSAKREPQKQAAAVLERNVVQDLALSHLRKWTVQDKEEFKRRRREEALANPEAHQLRKKRLNKKKNNKKSAKKRKEEQEGQEKEQPVDEAVGEEEAAEKEAEA